MRNRRVRPLFFAILTMILLIGTAPVLASGWNPLFFWKKAPVQQDSIARTPSLFSRATPKAAAAATSSTVLSANGIMQRASVDRMQNVEQLVAQRRRLNTDMITLRKKQREHAEKLAVLDQKKTYAPVYTKPATVKADGTQPAQTKKTIYVKPALQKPPKVFTDFR